MCRQFMSWFRTVSNWKWKMVKMASAWDRRISRCKHAESVQTHYLVTYIIYFVNSLGPKGWGYGEMVDAADLTRLSLGMETYQVAAPRFRGTWDLLSGNPEPNLVLLK